jgi:hypothetical protein
MTYSITRESKVSVLARLRHEEMTKIWVVVTSRMRSEVGENFSYH